MPEPSVEIGSIWQDADPREHGHRFLRVVEISDGFARCHVARNDGRPGRKTVNVRLDRFRPNRRGYRRVDTIPGEEDT